jgi:valyl-tRNA synthetase
MKLLHPFMPFLTEELWQTISERILKMLWLLLSRKKQKFDEKSLKTLKLQQN